MGDGRDLLLLLGAPALHRGGDGISTALPQKAFVLAAVLQLSVGRRASRSWLATSMYEDAGQAGALANLRQLLSRIHDRQTEFGVDILSISRTEVRLVAAAPDLEVDLATLDELEAPRTGSELARLVKLYRGDLLEGVSGCGEALDAWIRAQRVRLRERYGDLVLAGAATVGGVDGETALRRLLDVDPYREDAWRSLIGLRAKGHGIAAAQAVFAEMRCRFEAELGTSPDGRTAGLLSELGRTIASATEADVPRSAAQVASQPEPEARQPPSIPKLCVLMPVRAGVEDAHVDLAEALVEDVVLGLCRLRSIAVIAPHTTRQLSRENPPKDLFGARYVAETSVRSFGGGARLVVRLVRMVDRVTLWGEEFDLRAGDPGEHHRLLSRSIVTALADRVERMELARFESARQPDAYHLYLRGRSHLQVLDLPDLRRARKAFAQAAERAPEFVPALNGIARTFTLEWLLLSRTDREPLLEARRIATRAVEVDPFSGEAVRELASATLFLGGLDDAVDGLTRAERLAPHHADILADHANALTHCSDMLPALGRIEKAIELNPIPPDDYLWTAAGALFFLDDYEGALSHLERMKRRGPANRLTAACLARSGRRKEAAFYVARALEDQPNFRIDDWIATIPLRSKDHVAHYAGALSEAGFR